MLILQLFYFLFGLKYTLDICKMNCVFPSDASVFCHNYAKISCNSIISIKIFCVMILKLYLISEISQS